MKALKTFVDFEKEELWLNRMADEGQLLRKVGMLYSFRPIEPGTATVRVDFRPQMSHEDFEDYRTLFSDAGWTHLAGSRSSGPQYFATFSGDPVADIFSENASRTHRYRHAITMSAALLLPLVVVIIALASAGNVTAESLFSPRDWYLTQGLWQMSGWDFTRAFLFETPFVVLRICLPLLLAASSIALLARFARQVVLYRRTTAGAHP
jgi:hypothetical protein